MSRLNNKTYIPLVLGPLILFAPQFLAGKSLFWGTVSTQFIPWWDFAWETILQGHLPLWNPWVGMGAPLLANYQSALLYPPYWFLFLVYSLAGIKWMSWSITFIIIFHLIWSGLGTARLLEEIKLSRLAQIVGGLSFSLSGYLVARAGFLSINAATAWLPWILLYSQHIARRQKKAVAKLGICMTLMLLAGHAQTSWYAMLLGLVWIVFWTFRYPGEENRLHNLWISLKGFVLAGIMGVGLSAVQLLPTAEYLLQSQRSSDYGFSQAMTYSFWPWRFLTVFVPDLFGNPARGNYWGYGNYWEDAVYIGLLPILVGLGVLIRGLFHESSKSKERSSASQGSLIFFLGSLVLISFVLALGKNTPIFPFLYRNIPTFDLFQAPTRFSLWAVMSLAILAGIGLDQVTRPEGKRKYWMRLAAAGCAAVSGGSVLGWILLPEVQNTFFAPLGIAGLFGLGTVLLILFQPAEAEERRYRTWEGLVVGLVMVDLLLASSGLNPAIGADFYQGDLNLKNGRRYYLTADAEYELKFRKYFRFDSFYPDADWEDMKKDLVPNLLSLQRREMVNNFDPLVPARYQTWIDVYDRLEGKERHQMTGLMNIGYLVDEVDGNALVMEIDGPSAGQELRVSALESISTQDGALLAGIAEEKISLEKGVVISQSATIDLVPCRGPAGGETRIVDKYPGYLRAEVDLEKSSWVVWSQAWYPGWIGVIDGGEELPVERANYLFQAVCLPPGEHTVEFIYRPVSFYAGAGTSLASLIILVGFLIWETVRKYR